MNETLNELESIKSRVIFLYALTTTDEKKKRWKIENFLLINYSY